jgi:hypothetical protein
MLTKVKPYTNSVKVQPQLSRDRHPVDGGCWFTVVGQLIVIEIILASNLGSNAEYTRVFWNVPMVRDSGHYGIP